MSWTIPEPKVTEGKEKDDIKTRESPARWLPRPFLQRTAGWLAVWLSVVFSTLLTARRAVREVLQKAVDEKVLMFCSALDQGMIASSHFPGCVSPMRVLRIGAAGPDGKVYNRTSPGDITYALPGIHVPSENGAITLDIPSQLSPKASAALFQVTGSSVATALGAGLAAMIIYSLKAGIMAWKINYPDSDWKGPFLPDDAPEKIAHPDEMIQAFAALGELNEHKFIQVWGKLDTASQHLEVWQDPNSNQTKRDDSFRGFLKFLADLFSAATTVNAL